MTARAESAAPTIALLVDGWRGEFARTGGATPESWPGGRLLAVSPRPEVGLEPHHLDRIEQFIATVFEAAHPRE